MSQEIETLEVEAHILVNRRGYVLLATVVTAGVTFAGGQTAAAPPNSNRADSAAQRMSLAGSEEQVLTRSSGRWNVISTLWPAPDAQPIITTGLIAERTMIGNYQQEIMKPAAGSSNQPFTRFAYLYYFRVEGCWQYVSMDTRFPVGIMPAKTCEKGTDDRPLVLEFDSLPFVGLGPEVEGRTINSNLEIHRESPDHEVIRQYWTSADGTGRRWLAVQYEYTRADSSKK